MSKNDGVLLTRLAQKYSENPLIDGVAGVAGNFLEKTFFDDDDDKVLKEAVKGEVKASGMVKDAKASVMDALVDYVNIPGLPDEVSDQVEEKILEIMMILGAHQLKEKIAAGEIGTPPDVA